MIIRTVQLHSVSHHGRRGPGGASDLSAQACGKVQHQLSWASTHVSGQQNWRSLSLVQILSETQWADGYTVLSARVGCQMGVPAMNKTIPYKWDDFTMLGLIERNPFVLVVNPKSSIKTFADFEKKIKNGEELVQ